MLTEQQLRELGSLKIGQRFDWVLTDLAASFKPGGTSTMPRRAFDAYLEPLRAVQDRVQGLEKKLDAFDWAIDIAHASEVSFEYAHEFATRLREAFRESGEQDVFLLGLNSLFATNCPWFLGEWIGDDDASLAFADA